MRTGVAFLLLAAAVVVLSGISSGSAKTQGEAITDVSWPNCRTTYFSGSAWGIVGVNGGLDFRSNPCLAQESSWFTHFALYINTGYPGDAYGKKFSSYPQKCSDSNSRCLAYNYGYSATLYTINYANKQQVSSVLWWLDVETDNSWTTSTAVNRADLEGAVAALAQHTFLSTIGFYSDSWQWASITGNWHNHLPSWVATGGTSQSLAVKACNGQSFTGGLIWLSQYTKGLDENYACGSQIRQKLDRLLPQNP